MIEKDVLRALVLEVVNSEPKTQVNHIVDGVERIVKERGLFPSEDDCLSKGVDYQPYREKQLSSTDKFTVSEVIWDLTVEHVLIPVGGSPDIGYPQISLTKFGQDYIAQTAPHYYDPQGYMQYLKTIVPNLDPVIEQYISESMNCYRQQLFFASAVMIGASAEKAVLLLLQAIHDAASNPTTKKKVTRLLERPNLPEIFKIIRDTLNPLMEANIIAYPIHRGSTEHLLSLFEMIRVQRNDAIHPISGEVDRTKVFLSLQTIPAALESIYKLIEWLSSNSIP